jgi:copper oxidase (laccase) domain-containing protein
MVYAQQLFRSKNNVCTVRFSGRQPEEIPVQPECISLQQVHGTQIAVLSSRVSTKAVVLPAFATRVVVPENGERIPGVDGIITDQMNVTLQIRTADCVPVVLAHPSGVVAALHAGRAGVQGGILPNTLTLLKSIWNISDQLSVWIGPHICHKCYQIDRENNLYFDLKSSLLEQLHQLFPPATYSLTLDSRCTVHDPDQLYSYRREGQGVPMNQTTITLSKC